MSKIEQVKKLEGVLTLKIMSPTKVYLKTNKIVIDRLTPEGGILEDRLDFNVATQKFEAKPMARAADEITLEIGEKCQIGSSRQWSTLKFLENDDGLLIFEQSIFGRTNDESPRKVGVKVYP